MIRGADPSWAASRITEAGARRGPRTGQFGRRVDLVVAYPRTHSALRSADAVIVSIGGNDLYGDSLARLSATLVPAIARERVLARVDRVIARIHTINPAARITLLGLYDPYHFTHLGPFLDEQVDLWDARLISRFAADRHVTVLRIADLLLRPDRLSPIDHFHPGSMGYALVAARIAPAL